MQMYKKLIVFYLFCCIGGYCKFLDIIILIQVFVKTIFCLVTFLIPLAFWVMREMTNNTALNNVHNGFLNQ